MKVLFLDIDGVLVTLRSFQQFKRSGSAAQADPDCVKELNRVVRETGATIVLSSTWRIFGKPTLDEKFKEWGIEAPIRDFTPDLVRRNDARAEQGRILIAATRGAEIASWLRCNGNPEQFAIVDDDADMDDLKPQLVRTNFNEGLTREKADELIQKLSNPH